MIRLASRFLGFWLVAAALVAAVVDGAKSIAASGLVITPLSETWAVIAAFTGRDAAEPLTAPWPLDLALASLAAFPTVLALAVLGIFFLVVGAKRRPTQFGREYAA
ncbi:MAG TPA: PetM family of cytochrome b6f complex subunit 7 [Propylenella sp.]